jgi:fermentation-respiration switch protein FrsA (DUF1100 family)
LKNKKIAAAFVTVVLMVVLTGGYIGNYFINFALLRGNEQDQEAIPAACMQVLDPAVNRQSEPNFMNEEISSFSADGLKLSAHRFSPKESSNRWVIVVHGYGRDQNSVWDIAERYLKNGYNVLTPDLRASGKSEGRYLSMGYFESDDIKIWIDEIVKENPEAQIVLHGVSMGAATVMLTAEKGVPDNVKVLIEDCGYTSAYTMFSMELKKIFDLPSFPIMNFVDVVSRVKLGYFVSNAAPIERMNKITIPTLFIHGEQDALAPAHMVDELYNAAISEKKLLKIPNAGHADSRHVAADQYYNTVFNFIDQYI